MEKEKQYKPYKSYGDRSRTPYEALDIKKEMCSLADYDINTQKEWLGKNTKYYTELPLNGIITIYRAVPKEANKIRSGDYVTQSYNYAKKHLELVLNGNGKILTKKVKLNELYPVSANEFWYVNENLEEELRSY